ncbi:MAG: histidine kinase [Saprospiraceae bacterium]
MNKEYLHSLRPMLTHPRAFHIYLWGMLITNKLLDLPYLSEEIDQFWRNQVVAYGLMTTSVYFNLMWLAPKFLYPKKYLIYMIIFLILQTFLAAIWVQWHIFSQTDCILFLAFRNHFQQLTITSLQFLALQSLIEYGQKERRRQQLENEHHKLQLQQLKGQINPHFLFNTMNNFYALAIGRSQKLPSLILQHAELLRYALYETETQKVMLEKEIGFLINYIELERIRLEEFVEVSMEVNGLIQGQQIAPMLLVPLLDNAFKHCSKDEPGAFVHVELNIQGSNFSLKIENSKNTFHNGGMPDGGIGLENVYKRLALLYPNRHEIQIQKSADIFQLALKIAL